MCFPILLKLALHLSPYLVCMCDAVWVCVPVGAMSVEVKGQLVRVGFSPSIISSWGSNSRHQAWAKAPLLVSYRTSPQNVFIFKSLLKSFIYVCLCVGMHLSEVPVEARAVSSPGARVLGGAELLPDVAGNRTTVLCKSRTHS